ncbi:MAG: YmfQ family protein [Lachnospiraceae bacterium]|nr:YmfQ family protein [Lachnospiraceae bacterium]
MLIDYCPSVIKNIREMSEICNAEQPEFDNIHKEVDRLLTNRFISTADESGIERFEKELDIIPTPNQGIEERRIAVIIKTRKKSLSFKDIINMIRNYSNIIYLIPDYNKGELNVITRGTEDTTAIYETLDEIIALNISIHIAVAELGYIKAGAIWQDDEVFSLKEATL